MTDMKRAPARTAEQRIAEIQATERRKLTRKLAAAEKRLEVASTKLETADGAATSAAQAHRLAYSVREHLKLDLAALDAKVASDG
jgi:hypothetical protein